MEKHKKRNGLVSRVLSGESASVSDHDCETYIKDVLPSLLQNYSENDIFNADETGLFYKCLPDKTLAFKNEDCHGSKKSKERITVMVAANMSGTEKLPLLVIGKSKNPRRFGRKGVKSLPVTYTNNKKAWMNSQVYEEWLSKIDARFQRKKRKILLFVDNCPAHPKVLQKKLKAVSVIHLPSYITSKLQPMDMGIIKNLKFYYRKRLVKKLLEVIQKEKDAYVIDLLQAITLLTKAWNDVSSTTIANCFHKAGFKKIDPDESVQEEQLEEELEESNDFPDWSELGMNDVSFEDFVKIYEQVIVAESMTDLEILKLVSSEKSDQEEKDDEESDAEGQCETKISVSRAVELLIELRQFAHQQEEVPEDIFKLLNLFDDFCEKVLRHQSKLTNYFTSDK